MNSNHRQNDTQAIESRLAARLAAALTVRAEMLPHDVSERLRFARERALGRARQLHPVTVTARAPSIVGMASRGAAMLGGFGWWQRAASVLPLAVLVAGLVAINQYSTREQVMAAVEIDSQLLSDALPPAAYSDPGFAEYLRSAPTP